MRQNLLSIAVVLLTPLAGAAQTDPAEQVRRLELELAEARVKEADAATRARALESKLREMESRFDALAAEFQRVKGILKMGENPVTSSHVANTAAEPADASFPAPSTPIRALVRAISTEFNFVILNAGEMQGVEPGYRFEVSRDGERLAVLEVERYADDLRKMVKAVILEGDANKLKVGDSALAFRQGSPGAVDPATAKAPEKPAPTVSGRVNDAYMITFGSNDGAEVGRHVYVYRQGSLRGVLKLDYVDRDWSLAKRTEDTPQNGEMILEGDTVSPTEKKAVLAGRVHFAGAGRGIYVDIGSRDGAKAGMRLAVSRIGEKVGEIVLDQVNEHFSTAAPVGGASTDTFKKNDFVELVE